MRGAPLKDQRPTMAFGLFVSAGGAAQYAGEIVMSRHRHAEPGFWSVALATAPALLSFVPATSRADLVGLMVGMPAVVDDFGTLVPAGPAA